MINERQRWPLATKCSYRKIQWLFLGSLLGSLVAAAASLYGAAQYHDAELDDDFLTTALAILLLALVPLGIVVLLALRRVAGGNPRSTDGGDASPPRKRLDQQQRVWRHLRELHQQNAPEPHFLSVVLESLKALLGTPRISIWFFDDAGQTLTCRCSLPDAPIDDRLERQELSHYFDTLHRMPYVAASHALDDPRLSELEGYLGKHGIAAVLDVGIFVGGELRGVLCCGDSQPRDWQPDEINTMMSVSGLLSQFAESLRRREVEDDLDQQIHFDPVTGLPNLRGLTRAILRQGAAPAAFHLVVVRIGGLRQINQQFGQEAGNRTLGEIAGVLRMRLMPQRRTPRLARLPGNYLAILLPGDSPDAWLLERLEEALTALTETPWLSDEHPCQLHFSPESPTTPATAITSTRCCRPPNWRSSRRDNRISDCFSNTCRSSANGRRSACASNRSCAAPWPSSSFASSCSRSSPARAPCTVPNCCCAGSIPNAACSPRGTSSTMPNVAT